MPLFDELRQSLTYLEAEQIQLVQEAFELSEKAHLGQFRLSGEPYITHPIAVAGILADMQLDHQSLMAALLHDVIEDTKINKQDIAQQFGDTVAELVDGVSKLTQIEFESRVQAQAENFRKMVLATAKDVRVIIIKLADRLHNMRTLDSCSPEKRKRIAKETLEIFAPISNRLGMHNFRIEFEDLGFATIYPLRYRVLSEATQRIRGNRKEILNDIENELTSSLNKYGLPSDAVWGREKHIYSIYKKMRSKKLPFSDIMDVFAFRIIVNSVDSCYRVLGVVHNCYKPVPERFKDYIAIPKSNGYQSLHTTLFGPYGIPIEIQIRTRDMENLANNGIAAHWLYKTSSKAIDEAKDTVHSWMSNVLDIQKSAGNSIEFIENVKIDLFPDEVFVFTPAGDIMELPARATPVDFAYAIHSDIGNRCVAAKIDKRLAPLSTTLSNGQRVEIITAPGARPNPAWLNFVVTGKARSNIRHYLKSQRLAEAITFGKRLLDRALLTLSSSLEKIPEDSIQRLLSSQKLRSKDELFEAIGLGNKMAPLIARLLLDETAPSAESPASIKDEPLRIKGSEGMSVTFADCCRPIPGDPIVGQFNFGKGIVVHSENCKRIASLRGQADKCIDLHWEDNIDMAFRVAIKIIVANHRGALAKIATIIADANADIDNITVDEHDGNYNIIHLILSVKDRSHLAAVMRRIKALSIVSRVVRIKSGIKSRR